MKNLMLIGILLFGVLSVKAQSYIGYLTDNYSGVNSVIVNPSNIVDSRFRTDINLAGASALGGNDFYGAKFSDLLNDDFDIETDGEKFFKDKNNVFGNIDVLGPSFMFNINKKNSIAVFTRARAFFNVNDINGETFENVNDDFDKNRDFSVNEEDFSLAGHAWAEIGLSYATVLFNKEQHFLKGGITLKYLQGLGNVYSTGKNVVLNYDADGAVATGGGTTGSINTTGEVSYGYSNNVEEDFDQVEIVSGANGIGADLGFTYEWRPDYKNYTLTDSKGKSFVPKDINKYKLKFGLAVTDFGSIKYKDSKEEVYNIANSISEQDFENEDDPQDVLEKYYLQTSTGKAAKAVLPTALHVSADWNINQKFYLNLNADISLTSKSKTNTSRIANIISLTPRFERKWFSFYSPISMVQHSGFQWGAGFRTGPLYVGSGSIVSLLIKDNSKAADVYVGLKIPVYQSRPKDKDADGVLDKVDDCPDVKGPVENHGCPWPDTDGDTVLDKDDDCPDVVGEVENKGCPWPDTDGDTVLDKDDDCPEVAGEIENKGCPWPDTDGDTVLDKDDDCPDVAGTVANNGCPEPVVTEEVQKTLNEYAKTILFDSGRSTIKEASHQVLVDIVKILKEYPKAKFTVEGHTDSAGSAKLNQRLSDSRANAVKNHLTENGIDQFRLSAVGYGEDRPIATNKTRAGRAQNRRVEINLVNE